MKTLRDKLRMAEFLVIGLILVTILYLTAPAQLPVMLYKANLVAFFAFMGYWIDRRLFMFGREEDMLGGDAYKTMQIRRAIIVGAVVIAGALAL